MNIPPAQNASTSPASIAPVGSNPAAQLASPIADLTYRNYDGPLKTRAVRWWIVAVSGLRQAFRKPSFWISVVLCVLPCFFVGLRLYLQGMAGLMPRGAVASADEGGIFAGAFFQVMQIQALFVFIVALIVGAGSIAADNGANALLVYLSKPLTKGDYLLGKWMALFLLIFGAIAVPSLVLYLFCLLMFLKDGFLSNEPLLIGRILLACAVPGALYASLLVGVSAWSKSAREAGGLIAALYFLSLFLSLKLFSIFTLNKHAPTDAQLLLRSASPQGIISELAQHIYGLASRHKGGGMNIAAAPLWPLLLVFAGIVALGIGAARAKVKAVEVVRG